MNHMKRSKQYSTISSPDNSLVEASTRIKNFSVLLHSKKNSFVAFGYMNYAYGFAINHLESNIDIFIQMIIDIGWKIVFEGAQE